MSNTRAIRSRNVVLGGESRPACIIFEDGRITAIEEFDRVPVAASLIDAGEYWVLPGLVDTHVHLNEPGRTEWEGFSTGTRAAAAGGYTCVVDMPLNSIPSTINMESLLCKRAAASGVCTTDYGFWGGVVQGNAADILPLAHAGVLGFKSFLVHPGVDEFTMVAEADLRLAMPLVAQSKLPLLVHAEVPGPVENAQAALIDAGSNWRKYSVYLQSRPDQSEIDAIGMMIRLCRDYHCRIHIVHLASALALPHLEAARREGLPVTVETCPHYLCFSAEEIPDGATDYKCAPPIRSKANKESLWSGLRDRSIDMITTDHSPCPPELKGLNSGDFLTSWGGVASLSVSLRATWTEACRRGFKLTDVARWMAEEPAKLAGLGSRKGRIEVGRDADFVIFDPNETSVVTPADLRFRHPVSPYLGVNLQGKVISTLVRGHKVFENGNFTGETPGQEQSNVAPA